MTTEREIAALLRQDAALAPDPEVVRARVRTTIARRRRRRRATSGGGVALAVAGLLLGVQALDPGAGRAVLAPATPAPLAEPAVPGPAQAPPHLEQMRAVFAEAGYDDQDAARLALLWRMEDTALVRALAGQQLTDGVELPLDPGEGATGLQQLDRPQDETARRAFRGMGFAEADAYRLGESWAARGDDDLADVEAVAGQVILDTGGFPEVDR